MLPVLVAAVALPVLMLVFAWYATLGEPYRPVFRRHRVVLPVGWPGLSILHISDLHVRRDDQRLLRAQRAALDALTPDLLRATQPRLGTFIVLGNHEHNAHFPPGLIRDHARGWRAALLALLEMLAPRSRSEGDEEAHAMAEALD